jgi:cobalt-zinc-cadmium efflux system outer membrane protein
VPLVLAAMVCAPMSGQEPAATEPAAAPLTLDELERLAIEHNPEIHQSSLQIGAALGLRRQVGLYPNPRIGLVVEEIPLDSGRGGGKRGGFLAQTLVTGGKLRLNRAIFDQEVERTRAVHELARLRELNRVKLLYYRAVAAQRQVELRDRLAELAREAVAVTEQLWNTGSADLPDRLAVEIELEKAELEHEAARRDLAGLWQELRATVGHPGLGMRPLADTLEDPPPALDAEATLDHILAGSPEVRFAEVGIRRAELALERERAQPIPDLELTAGVVDDRERIAPGGARLGSEVFGDVSIRVPVFDRNQGNIEAARAELDRFAAEVRRARSKIEARFAPVFASYQQESMRVSRYRESILARAEQAYQLHLARYRQMAAAYPQVLLSQRTLFEAETAYVGALGRLWESVVLLQGMLLSEEPSPEVLDDAVLRRTPIEVAQ